MSDRQASAAELPALIQGGMGVAVSNWRLARAVSSAGQLGVVSGTALDTVLVRRLQDGDEGGHMRRALSLFPWQDVSTEILRRYFNPRGRAPGAPYRLLPMYRQRVSRFRECVTVAANFVEVALAKEGHAGAIGLNLLTKVQMPALPSLYGAMLAGVDVVLMGAGIPREIPSVLDALSRGEQATIPFVIEGAAGDPLSLQFNPSTHAAAVPTLRRPLFLAIVSSHTLATNLARKSTGSVDGFVVEGANAGGHNAPPRGAVRLNEGGEPIYGERDIADLEVIRALGVPFWLAGGMCSPDAFRAALDRGAAGVQVGTAFAYSDESGFSPDIKRRVLGDIARGHVSIFTDPRASPTGFPFKLVDAPSISQASADRVRRCDLGYLRVAARRDDGRIVYRCPAAPVAEYVAAGGREADTAGRKCLCNGLAAAVGLAQIQEDGTEEAPLVTSGDSILELSAIARGRLSYPARDVVSYILGPTAGPSPPTPELP